jgi:tRNA dimethylallyltransferase
MKLDPPASKTACQAIGYRELISHLANPTSLDSTIDLIKISTRQFAKRQHTWFRNLEECQALAITGDESPELLADRILQLSETKASNDKPHSSP